MVTLTVQQAAWEWAWGRTGTALGITHPSLFTRRREKIETINYPLLGTSIPVNNFGFAIFSLNILLNRIIFYLVKTNKKNIARKVVYSNCYV